MRLLSSHLYQVFQLKFRQQQTLNMYFQQHPFQSSKLYGPNENTRFEFNHTPYLVLFQKQQSEPNKLEMVKHTLYTLYFLLPFLKQLNHKQIREMEVEGGLLWYSFYSVSLFSLSNLIFMKHDFWNKKKRKKSSVWSTYGITVSVLQILSFCSLKNRKITFFILFFFFFGNMIITKRFSEHPWPRELNTFQLFIFQRNTKSL